MLTFVIFPKNSLADLQPHILGVGGDERRALDGMKSNQALKLVALSPVLQSGEIQLNTELIWERSSVAFSDATLGRSGGLASERFSEGLNVQYGLFDWITLGVSISHTALSKRSIDASKYRKTLSYENDSRFFESQVVEVLQSQAVCGSDLSCLKLIDSGIALMRDDVVSLPNGETLVLRAGIPLKDIVDSAAIGRGLVEDGETGFGDLSLELSTILLEMGGETPRSQSEFGLGLSILFDLPTGSFVNSRQSQIPTGVGVARFGAAVYSDFRPERHIHLGASYRSRIAAGDSQQKPSSYIDSSRFQGVDAGEFKWKGAWQEWSLHFGYDWSGVWESSEGFTTAATWILTQSPEGQLNGLVVQNEADFQALEASFRYAFSSLPTPLAFEVGYRVPFIGEGARQDPALSQLRAQVEMLFNQSDESSE